MTRAFALALVLAATAEVWSPDGGYQSTALQADGGTGDPAAVVLDPSGEVCSCSSGASCRVRSADGGFITAPLGATLHGATGSGCLPTPCVQLFGQDSPFNQDCACPSLQPDGGGAC